MPAPDLQLRQQVLSMRILPAHSAAVEGWLRPCLLVIVDARCDGSTDEPGYLRQNSRTMRKGTTTAGARARRLADVRAVLESRRAELSQEVDVRIRDVRSDGTGGRNVLDGAESSEIDIQDDIEFALIQMKAETLKKIDTALRRIEVITANASSAEAKSPKGVCAHFRLQFAAETVKRFAKQPTGVSGRTAARRLSSLT